MNINRDELRLDDGGYSDMIDAFERANLFNVPLNKEIKKENENTNEEEDNMAR